MDEADVAVQERRLFLLGSVTMMLWPETVPHSDCGTVSCTETSGEHLPEWLHGWSRGFPTSCLNVGSVIHLHTFVVGQMKAGSSGTMGLRGTSFLILVVRSETFL